MNTNMINGEYSGATTALVEMINNGHKNFDGYDFCVGNTFTKNCGVLLNNKYKVVIYKIGTDWLLRVDEMIETEANFMGFVRNEVATRVVINDIDGKQYKWCKRVVENAAEFIADIIDDYETKRYDVVAHLADGDVIISKENGFTKAEAEYCIMEHLYEDDTLTHSDFDVVSWDDEEDEDYVDVNVADYLENGCDKPLPTEIVKQFDGKPIVVKYDNYPCKEKSTTMKDWKGYEKQTAVVYSPKTYGDIVKPYADNVADLMKKIDSGELPNWDYGHTTDCLWVEGFDFGDEEVTLGIGS